MTALFVNLVLMHRVSRGWKFMDQFVVVAAVFLDPRGKITRVTSQIAHEIFISDLL